MFDWLILYKALRPQSFCDTYCVKLYFPALWLVVHLQEDRFEMNWFEKTVISIKIGLRNYCSEPSEPVQIWCIFTLEDTSFALGNGCFSRVWEFSRIFLESQAFEYTFKCTLNILWINQIKPTRNIISHLLIVFVNTTQSFLNKMKCSGYTVKSIPQFELETDCPNEFRYSHYPIESSIPDERYYCCLISFDIVSFVSARFQRCPLPLNYW